MICQYEGNQCAWWFWFATKGINVPDGSGLLQACSKPEPPGTLIPFVLTYHPELPKVKENVNKHWPIIKLVANQNHQAH